MTIAILTHVIHSRENGNFFAYGPYVREMNIWSKFVADMIIVAPYQQQHETAIDLQYDHPNIIFKKISAIDFLTFRSSLRSIIQLPFIIYSIFGAMRKADHIHLRCPGNIGLLGCFVQVFFPGKPKTAKYAGNWDPMSVQPLSYRLQKWILSNTFLTRNMKVLVYGEWADSGRNVKSFFTASYSVEEKTAVTQRKLSEPIRFLFVGTLSEGKQPLYAVKLVEQLNNSAVAATLDLFGEGKCRHELTEYIAQKSLNSAVKLRGNCNSDTVKKAYQNAHFLLLPSKSEGWPKAVAEAMFWGCVPASTNISCVPYMLDNGQRGVILTGDLNRDANQLQELIADPNQYAETAERAMDWSRQFTIERFEAEIHKLLQ